MARRCSFVKRTNKKNRNRTRNRTRTRTRNRTNNKNRTKRINQKGGAFELKYTLVGENSSDYVNSVAFDPTGLLLATGSDDDTAKLWRFSPDGSTATCVATLAEHSGYVWSVAFHPTGLLLATGSQDKTAKLWRFSPDDGSTATCVATLEGHGNWVNSVAFHPTAPLLATGSSDQTAKLWNITVENTVTHEDIQPIIVSDDDDTRLLDTDGENKSLVSRFLKNLKFRRKYNV